MKALIVDGNSILNRSFYGIKLLSNKKGQYTNAIYGFLTSFQKVKEEYKPEAIAIAFDLPYPTFRKEIFKDYKANRKGMPNELASQLPILKELLTYLGYKIIECPGYEADDILGTLSKKFEECGHEVLIYTGDRDSLQLVSNSISVRLACSKNGKSDFETYDTKKIKEVYGVSPLELIEIKALQGDTSDNIPGVKGIGSKIAEFLVQNFKSLDNIYKNIMLIEIKEGVRKKLIEGKDSAYMSRKLGKINLEAPIETGINFYLFNKVDTKTDTKKAKNIMVDLELFSLIDKFIGEEYQTGLGDNRGNPKSFVEVERVLDLEILKHCLEGCKEIVFNANFEESRLKSFAVLCNKKIYYIENLNEDTFLYLKNMLENKNISKIVYDAKNLFLNLNKIGINIENICFDITLASYILNPSSSDYSLQRLSAEYNLSDFDIKDIKNIKDENDKKFSSIEFFKGTKIIGELKEVLFNKLSENNQLDLLFNIELPLAKVLAQMENYGFKVDKQGLVNYSKVLSGEVDKIQSEIYNILGFEFNINSPKQLGVALFETLGLPKGKKGKSGYSTSAEVLEGLRAYHPVIDMILKFRAFSKLKSTFCDGMVKLISADGRIHARFNQTETRTGRISCTDPNLQNIPVRTETGRELRKYFCTEEGYVLVDADYSQIELRVLAHLSKDKNMIEAFKNDEDIHTLTASKIFNLPSDMIGSEARTRAKAVNFGIIYGMGAFSLAKDLGVTRAEASRYIKAYLSKYNKVDLYLQQMVSSAKTNGYSETMFNRRRYLPELSSSNFNLRAFGERVARNMPIQGSAADIIKIAMIKVDKRLKNENLNAKLILQIHDELIVESRSDDAEEVKLILKEEMENAVDLLVPLKVNISLGKTWYDAKT